MNVQMQLTSILSDQLSALGFVANGPDWLTSDTPVVSIVSIQEFSLKEHFTINFGFCAPAISRLNMHPVRTSIAECNSTGFSFRPREIGISAPPVGWRKCEDISTQLQVLNDEISHIFVPVFRRLSNLHQWICHCEDELGGRTTGRGRFWTRIVDVMLVSRDVADDDIEVAIRQHEAEQSIRRQNRLTYHIDRQRSLIELRRRHPDLFFEQFVIGD